MHNFYKVIVNYKHNNEEIFNKGPYGAPGPLEAIEQAVSIDGLVLTMDHGIIVESERMTFHFDGIETNRKMPTCSECGHPGWDMKCTKCGNEVPF